MDENNPSSVRTLYDLPSYQRRLRHIRSITLRNLQCKSYHGRDITKLQVYFTLHTDEKSKEFYKSEIVSGSLNPSWLSFDISQFEEQIDIQSKYFIVRVWITSSVKGDKPKLLVDWSMNLSGVVFFSDKLQQDIYKYVPNMVILGMFDRYFIAPDYMTHDEGILKMTEICTVNLVLRDHPKDEYIAVYKTGGSLIHEVPMDPAADCLTIDPAVTIRNSYTINSLSRIHTVLRAIKQMQASVKRVHRSIEDRLLSSQEKTQKLSEREDLVLRVSQLKNEMEWQISKLQHQKDVLENKRVARNEKSQDLKNKFDQLEIKRTNLQEKKKNYFQIRESYIKENAQLIIRRKQLISELTAYIYPITETPKRQLCICGVRLPNSEEFQGKDDTMCAVALGYTSHLVMMISQILDCPLRYLMDHKGSKSFITDHIHPKLTENDKTFPLFSRGKEKFQFNYGVFLLNKNISQVRFYCGLATSDLRLTLPNIKTMLERLGVKFDSFGTVSRQFLEVKDTASIPSAEKAETISSIASGGVNSGPDPAEEGLENALKTNKDECDSNVNANSSNDIPLSLKNLPHKSDENGVSDGDDLFKPSDDAFFKLKTTTFLDNASYESCSDHTNGMTFSSERNHSLSPSPVNSDNLGLSMDQSDLKSAPSKTSLHSNEHSGEETRVNREPAIGELSDGQIGTS